MSHSVNLRTKPTLTSIIGSFLFSLLTIVWYWNSLHQAPAIPLFFLTTFICFLFLFVEPIPQPQSYHNFADKRGYYCSCGGNLFLPASFVVSTQQQRPPRIRIPNFGDVASNTIILIGGVAGLLTVLLAHQESNVEDWSLGVCLPIFFSSTIGVALGSTYYHWQPNNARLVWDRIPMTVAFMAIFSFMLGDYVAMGLGQSLLAPFIMVGILSVWYWRVTDDLRLYAVVAILPLCCMPILMVTHYPPRHTPTGVTQQAIGLVLYAVAKVCEDKDSEIYCWTGQRISGHSLKHILAGLAPLAIAHMVWERGPTIVVQ